MDDAELERRQGKRAEALSNQDFICIKTFSGRGLLGVDPDGAYHLLDTSAADEVLGLAVLDALKRSRFISMDEYQIFFDPSNRKERYAAWIASLTERYHYKTKRALFKGMKNCTIHQNIQTITFSPTYHERLEGWAGQGEEHAVVIAANNSPAEVGSALRQAFARCT